MVIAFGMQLNENKTALYIIQPTRSVILYFSSRKFLYCHDPGSYLHALLSNSYSKTYHGCKVIFVSYSTMSGLLQVSEATHREDFVKTPTQSGVTWTFAADDDLQRPSPCRPNLKSPTYNWLSNSRSQESEGNGPLK